ncbi:hypothetical protein SAMN04487939_11253 [Lysobacter sp. yr284]|uniref:hypothetical protein n=1 Tax=Lysobacter sp. yr284 TaxID=1761791 RepID=UPI00089B9B58|nr:hypothetical protein [Lysobacter sp. yr284]SDZ02104.1 hypothetical protein SAMN04487939_11253 [Lysobacter sp. yr284]
MIVYRFGPHSADELTLWFDRIGAEAMLAALRALASAESDAASEELRATGLRKASASAACIVLARAEQDEMIESAAAVSLGMADETVDYAQHKLREFLVADDFAPAEFAAFEREGRRYDTQVYFCRLDAQIEALAGV